MRCELLIVFVVVLNSCSQNTPVYEVHQVDSPIIIDGLQEANWTEAKVDTLNGDFCGNEWHGVSDFQVLFSSMWDEDFLYFFFRISDENVVFNNHQIVPWFENDLLELFIADSRKIKEAKIRHMAIFNGIDSVYNVNENMSFYKWDCKTKEVVGGYQVELSIPWSEINVSPIKGREILFNAEGADADLISQEEGVFYGRDITLSWSPHTCRKSWRDSESTGVLILAN